MDKLDLDSLEYAPSKRISKLVNNELLSDVTFLVGESKIRVFAHQILLSIGSEVFYKSFYGDLKSKIEKPIEIPDLEPNGFINMIKYIYCGRINLKVEDIYSTYLAADKYLVHKFPQALSKYIRSITNYKNCFLIFDNLNRIKFVDSKLDILPYDYVERIVQSASNLDTEYFSKINQNSLIEILKMNTLNVSEIKLLQACVDWVDSELKRTNLESNFENCSKTFNQIKPFICFSQIDILELKNFSKIKNYLSSGDILEFFFYSDSDSDSKSTSLDLTRKREKSKSSTVLFGSSAPYRDSIITLDLKVGKSFSINYLVTAYSNLEIVNSYENNKSLNVKWSYAKNIQPSQFLLKPEFPIILKPGCTYEFTFKSPNQIDSIYKAIKEDLDNVGLISKRQHCFSSIVGFILDN